MENFGDLGKTLRSLKEALHKKTSLGPKKLGTLVSDEASHAQRGGSISALVTNIACVAKNMIGRHVEITLETQQKCIASACQRDIPLGMSNTKCDTSRVFGT